MSGLAARRAALLGAASLFLWMFLAAAPIETLADTGGLAGRQGADVVGDAYRVAADWRHGMAGNAPLYMPGFFALALASWSWSASRQTALRQLVVEGLAVLVAGQMVAWLCAGMGAASVAAAGERTAGLTIVGSWPPPTWRAVGQGLYTAAAWMVVVVACRRALAARSFVPLAIVPPITALLVLVRPWTVDDFVALWIARATSGDAVALGSAVAVPVVAVCLVLTEWSPQWVHTHWRPRRIGGTQ